MATIRTPNSFLVFIGSLGALLLVAILFIVPIANGPKPGDLDKKRGDNRLAVRSKLEEEARTLISTEGFVDKAKGVVHVPVNSLFASVAGELAAKKPAPSQVKVEAPLPMPVVDPKSTEPPVPALPSAPQGADTIRFTTPEPVAPKPAAVLDAPSVPIASTNFTETK